jgi:FixJ family two-component response regulator
VPVNYQTIGIIDPDLDSLNLYEFSLQEFGYKVMTFLTPQSLLEYLHTFPYLIGFLIIEYKMPRMTGCELAIEVNAINQDIKMVFLTGYDNIVNNKFQLEIIKKPITLTRLLKLVEKYMK